MNRVQKGNTTFRPVTKARPRITPTSRSSSAAPAATPLASTSTRPPPFTAPESSLKNADSSDSPDRTQTAPSIRATATPTIPSAPMVTPFVPPTAAPSSAQSPPIIVTQVHLTSQNIETPFAVPRKANPIAIPQPGASSSIPVVSKIHPKTPVSMLVKTSTVKSSQVETPIPVPSTNVLSDDLVLESQDQRPANASDGTTKHTEPESSKTGNYHPPRIIRSSRKRAIFDDDSIQQRPKKKRRKSTTVDEDSDSKSTSSKRKRKKSARSQSQTKSKRHKQSKRSSKSHTPAATDSGDDTLFLNSGSEHGDDEDDGGIPVDPLMMTMAALCSDGSHGKVSSKGEEIQSNYVAWKARNKEKRAEMRATMERRKRGIEDDEESNIVLPPSSEQPKLAEDDVQSIPSQDNDTTAMTSDKEDEMLGADFDYTQNLTENRNNVQFRVGANGAMVIDEESMFVNHTEADETEDYAHVEESDATKFVNSGSYSRKLRGSRWSAEETELFYHALSQYGQNFELIACVMPGRDRKSCKNKFKAEDKKNSARITHCLKHGIPVDMNTLSRMTGKDFSGPVPEIKIPERPVVVPSEPQASEAESDGGSVASTSKFTKKRSRSATTILQPEDGVQIIGSADDFFA